jgi:oxaloacetate decarboxylase alpha subunit
MSVAKKNLGITEVALRDGHQSLFATRLRLADMLPIAAKLDQVGYWSIETWGGATFDACIRYLGEDPWDRIRQLKAAMPNTPQQMLLRAQNILGYRHYADDVVNKFVERSAINGVDVFRVFDAMNDPRNLATAIKAVKQVGKHAQGTISYTLSPVHHLDYWVDLAEKIAALGADSICIKDMAGLLNPYTAFELVTRLKHSLKIPIHMHCHATTGLSTATIVKAVEAGIDNVDTSISSMSMTYGHSPSESVVSIFEGRERHTGLNIKLLEEIAAYFREVRKKYVQWEGSLKGVDSRILVAQVPGGMLTNMESQLKEQGASDQLDAVLAEIPKVREDLGYIPLVTPTSQIVGTQAVLNVLTGERYKTISKETAGVLKGKYGAALAPYSTDLQERVLEGDVPITCRPADLLENEIELLTQELRQLALSKKIRLQTGDREIDDVLIYALFPQIGLKFLENRDNPSAFEPMPNSEPVAVAETKAAAVLATTGASVYTITVDSQSYVVQVEEGGDIAAVTTAPVTETTASVPQQPQATGNVQPLPAPLSGNIWKVHVAPGQLVQEGDVLLILEAMKMETEVRAAKAGTVTSVNVSEGDTVAVGDTLLNLA